MMNKQPRFLEQVRHAIRVRHCNTRTEKAYVGGVRRFILFHHKRHQREMAKSEVCTNLTHLAVNRTVTARTQHQSLNSLLFTYKVVLNRRLSDIVYTARTKKPEKLLARGFRTAVPSGPTKW